MSTDLQQQNNDYNQDFDDQDNCNNQQNQQQYQGGNPNNFNDNDDDDDEEEDDDGDDDDDQKPNFSADGPKCIRLRGLPWSATHKEILDFLKNVSVINGSKGIHLVTSRWDGKNTGEAFVEVEHQSDVDAAIKLNKNMMGHRYIEVFTANPKEAQAAMKKTGGPGQSFVVKLRGLPYAVTEQQVEEFFSGLEIKPDREGILFVMDRRGRATGEAYVQFESQEDTEQALGRNREKIGHRYIEIFRSSLAELKRSSNGNGRPGPYDIKDRGGNRGDFGGGRNNMMRGGGGNDWNGGGGGGGGSGGFGVGANNTLGFNNMNYNSNSGNFGNGFGNNGGGGGGGGGNFGNNGGGFGGNNGGGGGFGGNNGRFSGPNNGGGGGSNFSSDFGDFGNFGNNRNNNFNNGSNDFTGGSGFGGHSNNGSNFGTGGGNFGGNSNMGNFGNFGNGGNDGPNNMGGGGSGGGFNNSNMGNSGGGNFGPIGGGRNDSEFYSVHMRGLPYSSYENDVFKFFDPIRPSNVRINFNKKGLHGGTADVFFDTFEDAQLAMKRHKDQIGNRYIELFFDGKIKAGGNNNNMSNNNFSRRI